MTGLINFIKQLFSDQDTTPKRSYKPRKRYTPKTKNTLPSTERVFETNKLSTDSYLLEYRYSGYPKNYILDRYFELKRAYRITHPKYHYVPHMTIVGPIFTNHERALVKEIQEIIFRNAHHFHEPGNLVGTGKFITFETDIGGQVLAIEIKPPKSLVNLKNEIESSLKNNAIFKCQSYKQVIWHTTLWNMKKNAHENKDKFQQVWRNLENSPQEMKFILDRITLLKNERILNEFDLVELKSYSRIESLDENKRYESYQKLKAELKSKGESFKFFNQKTDNSVVYGSEEKDQEESTETQDGTIQAKWNF